MTRVFWYMALCLLSLKLFAVYDAQAEDYPPCWQAGEVSTHPLFHTDIRNPGPKFQQSDALRIAFIRDYRSGADVEEYVAYLQEALDLASVGMEVEIACVSTWTHLPQTPHAAYYYVRDSYSQDIGLRNGADLVAVLSVGTGGYCGVAGLSQGSYWIRTSATSCGPDTFAHEIGHNLGLHHAHQPGYSGRKGWCISPSDGSKLCDQGTLMSYARGRGRLKRYADVDAGWGTEEHTAAQWLRDYVPIATGAWEARYGFVGPPQGDEELPAICSLASPLGRVSPILPAAPAALAPTTSVRSR